MITTLTMIRRIACYLLLLAYCIEIDRVDDDEDADCDAGAYCGGDEHEDRSGTICHLEKQKRPHNNF